MEREFTVNDKGTCRRIKIDLIVCAVCYGAKEAAELETRREFLETISEAGRGIMPEAEEKIRKAVEGK